ncbi:MAG: hypothetical protein JXM69_07835 [Anaerolineae bacterium]|nr:hypothetical protein [Anaerolineae bacterium]
MAKITLFDTWPATSSKSEGTAENWYVEPFTKQQGCQTPGQCGDDCDCGCPYNTMTELEGLPLIEDIAKIFPNEWLAFITSPAEDDEYEPIHGKLIAHSPKPDEVYDAVDIVLWNQHVYVFFNGNFEAMKASYGDSWDQKLNVSTASSISRVNSPAPPDLSDDLVELIYSAIDQLSNTPNLNEAIRRLRLARTRAAAANGSFVDILDSALNQLETPSPRIDEVVWQLEERLAE